MPHFKTTQKLKRETGSGVHKSSSCCFFLSRASENSCLRLHQLILFSQNVFTKFGRKEKPIFARLCSRSGQSGSGSIREGRAGRGGPSRGGPSPGRSGLVGAGMPQMAQQVRRPIWPKLWSHLVFASCLCPSSPALPRKCPESEDPPPGKRHFFVYTNTLVLTFGVSAGRPLQVPQWGFRGSGVRRRASGRPAHPLPSKYGTQDPRPKAPPGGEGGELTTQHLCSSPRIVLLWVCSSTSPRALSSSTRTRTSC